MAKEEKTFDYPEDLRMAQRALEAVQERRRAFLAGLPSFGGDLAAAERGLDEEQIAESKRLEEEERQASHVVWVDEFWAKLPPEDRADARSKLKHLPPADA
ncbi:hypothetical protein AB0F92_40505 [Kitasatospora aureofaciens]|uniref:hypothetical protein n=1 Tax=Kitasatospora aureofaciens TaxID=1894 RepID=UPI0034110E56